MFYFHVCVECLIVMNVYDISIMGDGTVMVWLYCKGIMWGGRSVRSDSQPQPKREMTGFAEGGSCWSVFDRVKAIPPAPELLMAEINNAIFNLEYTRATALLDCPTSVILKDNSSDGSTMSQYDVRLADEAYKVGCAVLAAGKLDEALQSFNTSLAKCPPEKTSAVAKLQSLISLTSQQLQKYTNN